VVRANTETSIVTSASEFVRESGQFLVTLPTVSPNANLRLNVMVQNTVTQRIVLAVDCR
jgi:hypothetical protein